MSRPPSLNALQFFSVAARTSSFVQAAQELFVTHGAVSRQIRLLEEHLGVALFERRNRAVFLTHQGKQLKLAVDQMFTLLDKTLAEIQQPMSNAQLTVSCEPTILMKWLIPRLGDFYQRHPDISLHLFAAGGEVFFARDRIDVALRRNDFYWDPAIHSEKIVDEWMAPVCTPKLLRRGKINLSSQRLLHTRSRPNVWANWQTVSGIACTAQEEQIYEHFYLALQAAGAGLGVAVCSAMMVHDDIIGQRLVAPLGFVPDGSAYVLLSPQPFHQDTRRTVFLAWVKQQMEQTLADLGLPGLQS
ncbi:MAG: hypothetical protein RL748_3861 [Pseudomonadota bacterium]|jgi:DNA-binding transcriptional LysR family regulator